MSNPDAYIREINSLDQEIKRLNARLKLLRTQKKDKQKLLYKYMIKNKLESYGGKTLSSIRPRDAVHRKTEKQKKQEAIILFREAGIDNPEEFYKEFKEKLKSKPDEKIESFISTSSVKKEKNSYDPYLGF